MVIIAFLSGIAGLNCFCTLHVTVSLVKFFLSRACGSRARVDFALLLTFQCVSLLFIPLPLYAVFVFLSTTGGGVMSRRSSMGRGRSKKVFTKAAQRVHPRNSYRPMRGGIRL